MDDIDRKERRTGQGLEAVRGTEIKWNDGFRVRIKIIKIKREMQRKGDCTTDRDYS